MTTRKQENSTTANTSATWQHAAHISDQWFILGHLKKMAMLSHDLSPAQGDKSCQNVHLLHHLSAFCQYVWGGGGGQIITVMLAKGCQMGHVIKILINLSQLHTTLHNTFIPPRLKLVKGLTINKQYCLINTLSNIMQKRETIISKLLSIINTVTFLLNSLNDKYCQQICQEHLYLSYMSQYWLIKHTFIPLSPGVSQLLQSTTPMLITYRTLTKYYVTTMTSEWMIWQHNDCNVLIVITMVMSPEWRSWRSADTLVGLSSSGMDIRIPAKSKSRCPSKTSGSKTQTFTETAPSPKTVEATWLSCASTGSEIAPCFCNLSAAWGNQSLVWL